MPAPRRLVEVAGIRTAYLDVGSGPPVVAIHGVPTSSELFEPLLPALAGMRVIAPDLLGQGDTETPSGSLGHARYSAHLAGFLEAVAPPRFDLVVHDFGGPLGLAWAARHPDRVRRLVVLSTTVSATARWVALWTATYLLELAGGAAAIRRTMVRLAKRPGAIPPDLAERWARPWTRRRVFRGADLVAPWRLGEAAAGLPSLRVPALLVWGTDDDVFPASHAKPLLAALPDARLELVPGAGHWVTLDAPHAVGERVAAFLRDERITRARTAAATARPAP